MLNFASCNFEENFTICSYFVSSINIYFPAFIELQDKKAHGKKVIKYLPTKNLYKILKVLQTNIRDS